MNCERCEERPAKLRNLCGRCYQFCRLNRIITIKSGPKVCGLSSCNRKRTYNEKLCRKHRLERKKHDHTDARTSVERSKGLHAGEYEARLEAQGGRCALCKTPLGRLKQPFLYVDHDHDTKDIRGLLCNGCNTALGKFGDNLDGLEKRMNHPADKLTSFGVGGMKGLTDALRYLKTVDDRKLFA